MEHPLLKLEELEPETGTFTLSATGKTYRLRKVSLQDEVWLRKNFGGDKEIQQLFKSLDVYKIARIAWHQMFEEDKQDFKFRQVTVIDEDGKDAVISLGGVDLLFSMIAGIKEKESLLWAMLTTLGVSRPTVEKIEARQQALEDEKKKRLTGQP